jgi:murE/murF fusion protein
MTMLNEIISANAYLRENLRSLAPVPAIALLGVTSQSSRSRPGMLFVAKKGATTTSKNGHDFIDEAIAHGACAIVVDKNFILPKSYALPIIVAEDSEQAYAHLCEAVHNFPSQKLKLVGITGTNGKTSTSFMLHAIFKAAGFKPKIMGTLGMGDPEALVPLSHTTMEPEFISQALADFVAEGISHVIMEVSSHALSLNRVFALEFAAVGLTNITQDHLDFHGSIQEYKAAKAKLFWEIAKADTKKVLPLDNPFFPCRRLDNLTSFSAEKVIKDLPVLGDFHLSNASLASSIAASLGIDSSSIERGLSLCRPIPGRLELVLKKPCRVLVDYAHTPDALESVLSTVKKLPHRQIILVMGCGGDRDALKRPIMGHIAHQWADQIIITDDNPRTEDPKSIRQEIIAGLPDQAKMSDIADRKMAISEAIKRAGPDDIVLITGKGHEDYQIYGHEKRPFSDQKTANAAAGECMAGLISVDKEIFLQSLGSYSRKFPWQNRVPLTIDSRHVPPQSVFFALDGELHDGHDFIKDALANGAAVAVVKINHPKIIDLDPESLILVDDPLATFSELARLHIASMPAIRIALTGSNGKTTTKEMLKAALAAVVGQPQVFASPGNKNNHIGLPLSAFALNPQHRFAIFEMGMNHPHEIEHLCKIVEPQFGLITNISAAHEGNFADGIEGVQKAKAELFLALAPRGHAVINLDDPRIVKEAHSRSFSRTTTYGWAADAMVRIIEVGAYDEHHGQQRVSVLIDDQQKLEVAVPLLGQHHAGNAAAALAVTKALGLDLAAAAAGVARMDQTSGRMNVIKNPRGFTIINDGYNANPSSMAAGIIAAQTLSAERAIAVIGAMGELGSQSDHHHYQLGQMLALHFDRLFICGPKAAPVVDGALNAGYPREKIVFMPSSADLLAPLMASLEKGDLVFIKGSLSAKMEIIAKALADY